MADFQTLSFDVPGAWAQAGEGRFVPAGPDTLVSEGGTGLLWYTPEEFSDFELLVDWKLTALEDNSGVFLRFPTAELARREPDWKVGHEVQIDDRGVDHEQQRLHSPLHLTGAVYAESPASRLASKPPGEWNQFHILARGRELRVLLNGEEVCRHTASAYKSRAGRLGLQNHHEGSRVFFRAPRILRLK
jgi:hypothetical protein